MENLVIFFAVSIAGLYVLFTFRKQFKGEDAGCHCSDCSTENKIQPDTP